MDTIPAEYDRTADAILNRLRQVLGASSDSELARALGISRMKVHHWRKRDTRPYPECLQVADKHRISLDWLLTGHGSRSRVGVQGAAQAQDVATTPDPGGAERRVQALVEMLSQLDGKDLDAVLSDCFARAAAAQQIADLRQAVAEMASAKRA